MRQATMKAAVIKEYGGPQVIQLEDVPVPQIAADEVLIKVAATAFNPADIMIRNGFLQQLFTINFPYTLGVDISGVIQEMGNAVNDFKIGDRVFAYGDFNRNGAAAEFVACKATDVAIAPISIPLTDAAALTSSALTAWQGLFTHGNLQTGQRVLVTAAAGGVGTVAVQLAKWKETHVIGTASEHSISLLQELGVDEIIDYKKTKVQDTIKEPLDLIFNLAPLPENEVTDLLQLLKKGGTLVTAVMPARESIAQELGVTAIRMASQRNAQQLTHIATLVNLGIIKPRITERLPLENIRDVHERTEIKNGKTLIVVNDTIN